MEETPKRTESMTKANEFSTYKMIVVGILIGILGVYLRFAHDSETLSIVAWIILIIGAAIAFKGVFKVLEA